MPKKMTHDEFSVRFNERANKKYCLGSYKFESRDSEIEIFCQDHGRFVKKAALLLDKRNIHHCPDCYREYLSSRSKDTQKTFLQKVKKIFGNQYDFSQSKYIDSTTKVEIVCPIHGPFFKSPNILLNKASGCQKCSTIKQREQSVEAAKKSVYPQLKSLWPDYSIDLSSYKNNRTKIKVICSIHGPFDASSVSLLNGKGCPICGIEKAKISRRLTNDQFIKKARDVHGALYSYDLVDYVNAHTNVTIVCKNHGEFLCNPSNHIHLGRACPTCSGKKSSAGKKVSSSITQLEFENRAKKAHPHKNYDLSKASYVNQRTKVEVLCKDHGVFYILPYNLWGGGGCSQCGQEKASNKQRLTADEFISRSIEAHLHTYDYSQVEYHNARTHVIVSCYQHGPWSVLPSNHILGKSGCPICAKIDTGKKISEVNTKDTAWFITEAGKVHSLKYDYSNTEYKGSNATLTINCYKHGEFTQVARTHLVGKGCNVCANELRAEGQLLSQKETIERFRLIHRGRYDYSLAEIYGTKSKIKIGCPEHGMFTQKVGSHLEGKGCPKCSLSKGELAVASLLEKNSIKFEVEFPISDLVDNKVLRFDFCLPQTNTLIEYDGEQHFRPVTFGGMSEEKALLVHEKIRGRDERKNVWAKENGYRLIRIRFDENIQEVLEREKVISS